MPICFFNLIDAFLAIVYLLSRLSNRSRLVRVLNTFLPSVVQRRMLEVLSIGKPLSEILDGSLVVDLDNRVEACSTKTLSSVGCGDVAIEFPFKAFRIYSKCFRIVSMIRIRVDDGMVLGAFDSAEMMYVIFYKTPYVAIG